jgi:predicted methyltransferase MtxX (methanogen marker protein 4)
LVICGEGYGTPLVDADIVYVGTSIASSVY